MSDAPQTTASPPQPSAEDAKWLPAPNEVPAWDPFGQLRFVDRSSWGPDRVLEGYRLASPQDASNWIASQRYGSGTEAAKAFGEAALSMLAPGFGAAIETGLGVPAEAIRQRAKQNPVSHFLGTALPLAAIAAATGGAGAAAEGAGAAEAAGAAAEGAGVAAAPAAVEAAAAPVAAGATEAAAVAPEAVAVEGAPTIAEALGGAGEAAPAAAAATASAPEVAGAVAPELDGVGGLAAGAGEAAEPLGLGDVL